MPFVVPLDERFDDVDLELRRRGRQRLPDRVEGQHDLEAVLELGLGYLEREFELVPHATIETAGISRSEVPRGPRLVLAAQLDEVGEPPETVDQTCQAIRRRPVRLGLGHANPRRA